MSQDLWAAFGTADLPSIATQKPKPARPDNVLFDQETEQDEIDEFGDFEDGDNDDDFGDFEEAENSATAPAVFVEPQKLLPPNKKFANIVQNSQSLSRANLSLIDFDAPMEPVPGKPPAKLEQKQAIPSQSHAQGQRSLPIRLAPTKPKPAPMADDVDEDAWADFDDPPAAQPARPTTSDQLPQPSKEPPRSSRPTDTPNDASFDKFEGQYGIFQQTSFDSLRKVIPTLDADSSTAEGALPATNIPPPAIILSIFPKIFQEANLALQQILEHEPAVLQKFFVEPRVRTFFKAYLALCSVCAFVLAGRKQRWRRDKLLSQSMRISEAGSRIKGMKLASVDKTEVAREDQEAVEVLRSWKLQLGKLRRCVAEVRKASDVKLSSVPELSESMQVRVLKEVDGGIRSTQPCGLCGLVREERVVGVEMDIHDSFGEWWIDSAHMHRYCRNLWDQHKFSLRSR